MGCTESFDSLWRPWNMIPDGLKLWEATVDEELRAWFQKILEPDEDSRLAEMAEACNKEFAVPDDAAYSGDIVQELELADLLAATTGMESADASNVANEIVRCRKASITRTSTRRQRVENIINKHLRRTPIVRRYEALAKREGWHDSVDAAFERLIDSTVRYVDQSVAEAV
jgi:hypothetical protein